MKIQIKHRFTDAVLCLPFNNRKDNRDKYQNDARTLKVTKPVSYLIGCVSLQCAAV